jgi:hypothetical protein
VLLAQQLGDIGGAPWQDQFRGVPGAEPPPSTGEPDGNGPPGRSRSSRLQSWQTLPAAVVTAVAAIVGVLLANGADDSEPPPETDEVLQEASITRAWSEPHPKLPSPAEMWHLEGKFKNLQPGAAVVGLLGPETTSGNGERWVVANAVLDRTHRTWTVDLRLQRPGSRTLYQVGTASEDLYKSCAAETGCVVAPRVEVGAPAPSEPGAAEPLVDGFDPTTPLTDAKSDEKHSSPPPR